MDLLMVPQLDGGAYNAEPLSLLLSPTASLVQSPTLSWVSISRDVSPECMPTSATNKKSSVRPFKKRSGSAHSRSSAKVGSESSALPQHTSGASSTSSPSTAATSIPAKRKRRIRQMKVKVKPTTFICDSPGCGKVFSRAYNLTSHMKTHSAERPFLCGTCPLAFARRHDRERHVRLHTGEKPYSCESCGCVFMRNDALHRHQRMCGQSPAALMALLQPQTQIHNESTMAL
ncbi:hypothetical protein BGX21_007291 [Mortierella sp. AD011]|nr:hypothetical protein BGX20_002381 [Mortierella sp. AD010]KAF9398774.1 hypothetical protein BGX21_007291 [Mortierella sp. AD011]